MNASNMTITVNNSYGVFIIDSQYARFLLCTDTRLVAKSSTAYSKTQICTKPREEFYGTPHILRPRKECFHAESKEKLGTALRSCT